MKNNVQPSILRRAAGDSLTPLPAHIPHNRPQPSGSPAMREGTPSVGDPTFRELGPVLKWAGGKRQLLPFLLQHVPSRFAHYHEPFLGGGAMFFELKRQRRLTERTFLVDANQRLMTFYKVLRDRPDQLIEELNKLANRTLRPDYEEARVEFNRRPSPPDVRTAALFFYLNRLCFNGLFRVNSRGDFNVPYGRYVNPNVVRIDALQLASRSLQSVDLHCLSFVDALDWVGPRDFVYLDPPYAPVSPTSSFTAYDGPFGMTEQKRLAEHCYKIADQGAFFMLSNSYHPEILELYKGFTITPVQARRSINSVGERRGAVHEIVVRNYSTGPV